MFKKKFPSLSSLGSDGNTAFLRAARAGHLDKVLEHLKANIDINTSNTNGLNALHLASKDGHVTVVTELLKRGAVVDSATKKGNTALHIASLAGQEDVVKLLVSSGAAVNVQSQNGFTPLYMAAQENHDNVVRFLLANGANQSLATEDGFTPLAVAMQQGHDKVVAVLLENDTRGKVRLPALHIAAKKDDCKAAALLLQNEHNPDVTSKSGFTPLHIAAHYGNEGIANLLLNKGADVNYSAKHNISPLHVAAKWGKTNLVSLLLEKGATIESKTRDGLTPLHCAARSGHEQVVDMMLERGAPISSKTKNGLAPLHMAAQGDHVDAARILLYHKAPVDDVTVDYLTALHVAAHCGHVRVAKLLLDRKADPNSRALNGFTPLHIACKKNRIKVVELLLKHGGSIEATTESGLTPLHVASFMGCMNIVIFLLQNDASPDIPTVRGETPLHLAARANQTDIIRILLRNGAQVDARAREQQTPLHIASRLGNVDIVMLLLQHGAAVDSTTKDMYTALHIAAKEGQEEVASVLLEHGASLTATTKKGFTPLHLAAKYGNIKVAKLLLQKEAPVDAQGKNGVTPLHVASHYDHQNVALLLLDKGASPHATAKNGHTPLHIAARKNQMDIATTLLEYGAKANAESKAGFTPLHLSAQEGHTDMSTLLIDHQADTNHKAKNGLTPLHLCAQEDRVNVSAILVKNGAQVDSTTKAGYTPLHVASHFGQVNMIRFLVMNGADVGAATSIGYTPLHQAAQQGHTTIVNLLLEKQAPPNLQTNQGQTPLCIAQKLGYISVVETLKGVTEPTITNGTAATDEKYRVVAPETMQETFMSDSEDEGGEDTMLSDQPYRYLTVDEMKSLGDDSLPIDVTRDERMDSNRECMAPPQAVDDTISPQHVKESYSQFAANYAADNIDISRHPVNVGKLHWKNFLVSFLVDARGGAMRGCRHSGVRVIVPPRKAAQPMRVTCRYLKRDKLTHPPPLMEGEALASRILELGPVGGKFLGPVVIEVPHFGSLRGMEREIVILRSDNGETWREHTLEASDEAIHDVMNESFEADELNALEDPSSGRTTRILTTDFPQYFAVVSRIRQEVHAIGPEGGMVSSSVVPQVQAVFPQGALTKKIKVGLQAQPIPAELAAKLLGNRVAVSPIVTVEPRRRKFHKPITLTIPVPQAANKGMINQYSGEAPTLRLLCSITGGTTRAQWEDVTGSTPFTFVNDCVSFTTTVSARFWLMDCRNIADATKMATELYREAIHVPFMAKFVVFAKRTDVSEARLRVFCMTDDKEDKTLEHQEHFTEVAKSRDVEVLEGKPQFVEFSGNLVPVTKSGDQLHLGFRAFRENRLPFTVRVKDPHADTVGRVMFMREGRVAKGEPPQQPICILNIVLPEDIVPEATVLEADLQALNKKYSFLRDGGLGRLETYQRTNLRLADISNLIGQDWVPLANELDISTSDVNTIKTECTDSVAQQAMSMLRLWLQQAGNKANGNTLETALRKIGRDDIVQQCIFNVDQVDRTTTRVHTLSHSRDSGVRRNMSLEAAYDEQDIMKESESVEELVQAERVVPSHERRQYSDEGESKYIGEEKVVVEEQKSVSELKEIFAQDKRDRQYERQPSVGSVTKEETSSRPASMVEKVTSRVVTEDRPKSVVVERTVETTLPESEAFTVEEIRQKFSASQPETITTVTKVTKKTSGIPTPELAKKSTAKVTETETVSSKVTGIPKKTSEVVEISTKTVAPSSKTTETSTKSSGIPVVTTKTTTVETVLPKGSDFVSQSVSEVTVTTKTSGIPVVTKTTKLVETTKQVVGEAGSAEQRRDSELFQGVSEELGRLETTFRVEPVEDGILSPKTSKTPPPSPAEFNRDQTGSSQQTWSSGGTLSTELHPNTQEWSEKSQEKDTSQSDSMVKTGLNPVLDTTYTRPISSPPFSSVHPHHPIKPDVLSIVKPRFDERVPDNPSSIPDYLYVDMSRGSREHSLNRDNVTKGLPLEVDDASKVIDDNSMVLRDQETRLDVNKVQMKDISDASTDKTMEEISSIKDSKSVIRDLIVDTEKFVGQGGLFQKMAACFDSSVTKPLSPDKDSEGDYDLMKYFPEMSKMDRTGGNDDATKDDRKLSLDNVYVEVEPLRVYENTVDQFFIRPDVTTIEQNIKPDVLEIVSDFRDSGSKDDDGIYVEPNPIKNNDYTELLVDHGIVTTSEGKEMLDKVDTTISQSTIDTGDDVVYEEIEPQIQVNLFTRKRDEVEPEQMTVDPNNGKNTVIPNFPFTVIKPVGKPPIPPKPNLNILSSLEKRPRIDDTKRTDTKDTTEITEVTEAKGFFVSLLSDKPTVIGGVGDMTSHSTAQLEQLEATVERILSEVALQEGLLTQQVTEISYDLRDPEQLSPKNIIQGPEPGYDFPREIPSPRLVNTWESIPDNTTTIELLPRTKSRKKVSNVEPTSYKSEQIVMLVKDSVQLEDVPKPTVTPEKDAEVDSIVVKDSLKSTVTAVGDVEVDVAVVKGVLKTTVDSTVVEDVIKPTVISERDVKVDFTDGTLLNDQLDQPIKVDIVQMSGISDTGLEVTRDEDISQKISGRLELLGDSVDEKELVEAQFEKILEFNGLKSSGVVESSVPAWQQPEQIDDTLQARLENRKKLKKALSDESKHETTDEISMSSAETTIEEEPILQPIQIDTLIDNLESSVGRLLTDIKLDEMSLDLQSVQSRESSSTTEIGDRIRFSSEESDDLWWNGIYGDRKVPMPRSQAEYWESVRLDNLSQHGQRVRDKHADARDSMIGNIPLDTSHIGTVSQESSHFLEAPRRISDVSSVYDEYEYVRDRNADARASLITNTSIGRRTSNISSMFEGEDDQSIKSEGNEKTGEERDVRNDPMFSNIFSKARNSVRSKSESNSDTWGPLSNQGSSLFEEQLYGEGNISRILANFPSATPSPVPGTSTGREHVYDNRSSPWGSLPRERYSQEKEKYIEGNISRILANFPSASPSPTPYVEQEFMDTDDDDYDEIRASLAEGDVYEGKGKYDDGNISRILANFPSSSSSTSNLPRAGDYKMAQSFATTSQSRTLPRNAKLPGGSLKQQPLSQLVTRPPGLEPFQTHFRTPSTQSLNPEVQYLFSSIPASRSLNTLPILQHLRRSPSFDRNDDTPSPDFNTTSSSSCSSPDYFAAPPLRFPSLQQVTYTPAVPLTGPPILSSPMSRSYSTPPTSLPTTPHLSRRLTDSRSSSAASHSPSPGYNIASSNLQRIPPLGSVSTLVNSSSSSASFFTNYPYSNNYDVMTTSFPPSYSIAPSTSTINSSSTGIESHESSVDSSHGQYDGLGLRTTRSGLRPSPILPSAGYCDWSSQSDSRESTPRGGDTAGDWGPREAQSTTTTTTTTITRGPEGLIQQGAVGGVSVTTTETRVVEGSEEMKDLLEKLAAESRK